MSYATDMKRAQNKNQRSTQITFCEITYDNTGRCSTKKVKHSNSQKNIERVQELLEESEAKVQQLEGLLHQRDLKILEQDHEIAKLKGIIEIQKRSVQEQHRVVATQKKYLIFDEQSEQICERVAENNTQDAEELLDLNKAKNIRRSCPSNCTIALFVMIA
jgi:hypothetical protein